MFSDMSGLISLLLSGSVSVPDLVHAVRARGVRFQRHPLGFIFGKIFETDLAAARIHIWLPEHLEEQSTDLLIHDHVFRFTSWVLAGAVENVEYETDPNGEAYSLYSVEYSGGVSVLEKSNERLKLRESRRVRHIAPAHYSVAQGRLHETTVIGDEPATTVLLTEGAVGKPRVVGPLNGADRYTFERTNLSDSEMDTVVRRIEQKEK